MTLDLDDCVLAGSAMTTPFLLDGLARALDLPNAIEPGWDVLRQSLRGGGAQRVHQHVTAKLATIFGYGRPSRQDPVTTREGPEDGGWLMQASNGVRLRAWSIATETDLDATERSPRAHRSSPTRIAQRVLLSLGERAGLVTNGDVLRLLLCDPLRADSHLSVPIDGWRQKPLPPDSFRVLLALAGAQGLPRLSGVLEAARLHQAKVTTELRRQAKDAISGFINALPDRTGLDASALWHEGLVLVYRLLFILKLECPTESGAGFSFASVGLWRDALSPAKALAPLVRRHLDHGHDTGRMLETGLRSLFEIFRDGLSCSELEIVPLGGALFGTDTTPLLDRLEWGERATAILLDHLIWIVSARGERTRVHYGSLDVEDLGSVYEGLLEQEPGIATEPLIRVRHGKLEAVLPAGAKSAAINTGEFFLRAGMGRKATGSFYTPHEFVRFLVRETLEPKIAALSPPDDPHPARLLTLKIVDPATGSGHFLVEACRYLGEALLTACRICDERGLHDRIDALPDPDKTIASYLPRILRGPITRDLPPIGGGTLPIWLRSKQASDRIGETFALAGILCGRAAPDLPGPPAGARRRAHRPVLRLAFDTASDGRAARPSAGRRGRGTPECKPEPGTKPGDGSERVDRSRPGRSDCKTSNEGPPGPAAVSAATARACLGRCGDAAGPGRRRSLVGSRGLCRGHRCVAGHVDDTSKRTAGSGCGRRRLGPGLPGGISRRLFRRPGQSSVGCRAAQHQGFRCRLRSRGAGRSESIGTDND
jgi:hypothetical protein